MSVINRCPWARHSAEEILYHDTEWGIPHYDDHSLFELIVLESSQAGLSWNTIIRKRDGYRSNFAQFDPKKVARFTDADIGRIVQDDAIIRHRKKIGAAVGNARIFCEIAAAYGSFSDYIWNYVDGKPIQNAWEKTEDVPAVTPLAKTISKNLKKRGFTFLGPVTVYAFMQAAGLVNDHLICCFRYHEVQQRRICENTTHA